MTDRRCVFFDFDGTLADRGVIPAAHAQALRTARSGGHAMILCTGRPGSAISPEVAALFDGAVTSAGAHVRIGDEVLRDVAFPEPLARRAVEVLERRGVQLFALEERSAIHCTRATIDWWKGQHRSPPTVHPGDVGRGPADLWDGIDTPADLHSCRFAKIILWDSPVGVEQLAREMGPEVGALPNSITGDAAGGELHLRGIDKADGVRLITESLGLPLSASVGVGDGKNDIGMLRAAGTAVGIEGGHVAALAAADFEVPPPPGHGVAIALDRLGLI